VILSPNIRETGATETRTIDTSAIKMMTRDIL